jgi:autophagy-related protein 9
MRSLRTTLLEPEDRFADTEFEEAGSALLREERSDWSGIPNLDTFLSRLYQFWSEKGFALTLLSRLLNLATLAFTICFSAFLLLVVDWGALMQRCRQEARQCDVAEVGLRSQPLTSLSCGRAAAVLCYLGAIAIAWAWSALRSLAELPALAELRRFCATKLALNDADLRAVLWPELVARLVASQTTMRLSVSHDLTAHDICSRILRRENYLVGLLNKRALHLTLPMLPGSLGRRVWLGPTILWNLHWAVLDSMHDDFSCIRADFGNVAALQSRFRRLALLNLILSPFLAAFICLHAFIRHAERVYHHPSLVGARRWSAEARWLFREFNETTDALDARLAAAHVHATAYCAAFPNEALSMVARFVAYVVGAAAAALLALAVVDERILESVLYERNLLWWTALCGTILAISRALIVDDDPRAPHRPSPTAEMAAVVQHTHYLPRRWRNAAHTRAVHREFSALFPYAAASVADELFSILLAPLLLWFSLPASAPDIVRFVRDFTVHVNGVGDVCSLATFDFARHGSAKYGSPFHASCTARSGQGKLEKSFLSFNALYPQGWAPDALGRSVLGELGDPVLVEESHRLLQGLYERRAGLVGH